ncbi:Cupredoxin [Coniella lustricola]|uniref:Cupredoxin n=1 Tax=Coniella lustricola TaxID=2025994 RepID=A0A2T3A6F4_9PEZI|nr:Cupredoxin [Coniella lustricola]
MPYYDSVLRYFDGPDASAFSPPSSSLSFNEYGIPSELPVIHSAQLINQTELRLRTNFTVSRATTTREYVFNISHALAAPDGFYKPMILANGQSPGPLIEANTGDTVRVTLHNLMPNTTTSIHFHGINQNGSTWMDGVAGVTQCGIPAAGGSWTYEFVVTGQRGTFWWHAHAGVQFTDGLFGPIIIHDPDEMVPQTDSDEILFLGENYHAFAAELASSYLSPSSQWTPNEPGVEPLSDNLVLNGQNMYDCSIVSTTFTSPDHSSSSPSAVSYSSEDKQNNDTDKNTPLCTGGKAYTTTIKRGTSMRLRLINHSSYFSYWFSIDSHSLTIVEIDGVEVEPMLVDGVHVNIGQRYSVIVQATQPIGEYTIRSALERKCFLPYSTYSSSGLESIGYEARGVLRYKGAISNSINLSQPSSDLASPSSTSTNTMAANTNPYGCEDLPFNMPSPLRPAAAFPLDASSAIDPQYTVDFQFRQVGAVNRIFVNRTSWAPYGHDATLWQALEQDFIPGEQGVYNNWGFRLDQQVLLVPDSEPGTVQVAVNSLDAMEHPFHMHGHTVQIVGWGPGPYTGPSSTTTTWNLQNPMRRDTFTVPGQSHVVIRFKADNPGMWVLHCHVAWHLEAGMAAAFLERPEDLKTLIRNMDPEVRTLAQSFCPARSEG